MQSSWAALKHSRFQNYFTLEFFSTFQKVQLQQIRAADTFRFFNFGWDDLIDGSKEGSMDGRMVPRQIMVFLFRLCLLGIILPSLWRENLTLRIFSIFFFNFGWDDLVDSWKEGRMDGRMVPRRIMVFVFRLCRLGIILPSLWRENLTLRILFQLYRKMIKGRSPGQIFGES